MWLFLNTSQSVFRENKPAKCSDLEHEIMYDVAFSTYLTLKNDPQHGRFEQTNNSSAWHKSLTGWCLRVVVFHDGLDSSFTVQSL